MPWPCESIGLMKNKGCFFCCSCFDGCRPSTSPSWPSQRRDILIAAVVSRRRAIHLNRKTSEAEYNRNQIAWFKKEKATMITIMHSDPIMDSPVYSTRLDYTLLPDPSLPHEKKRNLSAWVILVSLFVIRFSIEIGIRFSWWKRPTSFLLPPRNSPISTHL